MCEKDVAQCLQAHDVESHPKGETLPMQQCVFRVEVVTAFLWAGVPLNKLDHFRDIQQESAYSLTDRRHMSDLVPIIFEEEQAKIKQEIEGQDMFVIFDGTTRLGAAMVLWSALSAMNGWWWYSVSSECKYLPKV